MNQKEEIKYLILWILQEKSSYEEVVRLVHVTKAIAKSYLKHYYSSFHKICTTFGWTVDDLAKYSILGTSAGHSKVLCREDWPNIGRVLDSYYSKVIEGNFQ